MASARGDHENVQALRQVVQQRQVCFDSFPERLAFKMHGTKAIGYELVLSGIHSEGAHAPTPGCALCKEVYDDLKTIAKWILPEEHRPSFYEIEPYRPAIHATRKRGMRDEVTLSIKIFHRDHFEDPIDKCETRCLVEMETRLEKIGASRGEWNSTGGANDPSPAKR
jgi:hypothetical protein